MAYLGSLLICDLDYNKAIAASPVHALPGYIMGGLSWFAIPVSCLFLFVRLREKRIRIECS